jgi:parvulin-like peptidyl-prolyl isomerase
MRRNAGLRALIQRNVNITRDAMEAGHQQLHGPKRQSRWMVLPDLESAQAAINLVKSGASFIDVAVEMSTDSSAARGGLLEPISRFDPAYPETMRQTLWALNPGEMSGPVAIGNQYAVVMLVKRLSGDGLTLQDTAQAVERFVRAKQERQLMDQLAHTMLKEATVKVFDESLSESWSQLR